MLKISSLSLEIERTTRAANLLVDAIAFFVAMFILYVPIVLIILITNILGYAHVYTIQVQ